MVMSAYNLLKNKTRRGQERMLVVWFILMVLQAEQIQPIVKILQLTASQPQKRRAVAK
jgi:hypothetical protein